MIDDTEFAFPPAPQASVPIVGRVARFPVHRIYCVGRNFAEHAKEMGAPVERGTPVFFSKPADAVVPGGAIRYPTATQDLHHEVELVVALGADAGGAVTAADAMSLVFGYTVGLDLTRRDLQAQAKEKRLPWDTAKGFDASAPIAPIVPAAAAGDVAARRLWLDVGGVRRQDAPLSDMIFGIADVLAALSALYALRAGDLVFMGTPAGVAALQRGDRFHAGIDGLAELHGEIV